MNATSECNLNTIEVRIEPKNRAAFATWQADFNETIVSFANFDSLEIFAPMQPKSSNCRIIQRFHDASAASAWMQSPQYAAFCHRLRQLAADHKMAETQSSEPMFQGAVTELFVTQVSIENTQAYRHWMAKIHEVEAKFPGFRGVRIQAPRLGNSQRWLTLLQFDTLSSLERWLESSERQALLKQAKTLMKGLESHRLFSPYGGWFAALEKNGTALTAWKQTMVVLLLLFPIVMLEMKYLNPLLTSLDISPATFIGNALSVSLIAWPMTPIAVYCLRWWLLPSKNNALLITFYGLVIILFLYYIEIMIFWNFL